VCGAAAGLAAQAAAPSVSHPGGRRVLVIGLLLGALGVVGRAVGARGHAESVARAAGVAWPALAVLAALPLALRYPAALGGHLAAAMALTATLILAGRVDRVSPTRIPIVVAPVRRGHVGAWELSLLVVALTTAALYLQIGLHAEGNLQNDSAYYFGVARHMARTGRFEEPILWHFMAPPKAIVHAPFDYWGGLTSVVLAPFLALFGPSQHTAFVVMGAISGLSVIAFWYLVCVALPVRYPALQLLALLAFAFASSARNYRFDTESLPLYHLLQIGALIGVAAARPRLAVVSAFLLALCRIDGLVLFAGTVVVVALQHRRDRPALRRALLLAGGLLAAYVARNLWSFHAALPPGAATATRMGDERVLYRLHGVPASLWTVIRARFEYAYVAARFELLLDRLLHLNVLPAQQLWYLIAAIPGLAFARRRGAALVPGAAFLTAFAFVWASGPMFQVWRTLSALLPLLVLGGTLGLGAALDALLALTRRARRRGRRAWALCASALVFAAAYPMVTRIQVYGPREEPPVHAKELELARLDAVLAGMPVAATEPWYVMAGTRSPVVSIPEDGPEAVAEVLRRYRVEWIVLVGDAGPWRVALGSLREGEQKAIGAALVQRAAFAGTLALYRVVRR
jgi:hypothetical protein